MGNSGKLSPCSTNYQQTKVSHYVTQAVKRRLCIALFSAPQLPRSIPICILTGSVGGYDTTRKTKVECLRVNHL
jgi:hypothetical protein